MKEKSLLFYKLLGTFLVLLMGFGASAATYDVVVAKDGSGAFKSVQAAINAAPDGRTTPYKIYIKAGKYSEQIIIPAAKTFIELIGESPANTILSYGDGLGGTTTVTINANDCMLMNLTLENTQGYVSDGPQSLAVKANADRAVFYNCRFISGQDTVYTPGNGKRAYFKNCYIDGNTDFIYGASIAVFDYCIVYGRDRVDGSSGGYITAANTPQSQQYGLVFRDCIIPKNGGVTNYSLARPWQNDAGYAGKEASRAGNKTVFLNTTMSSSVIPAGWSVWDAGTNTDVITFAEYKTKKSDGSLADVSKRVSWSKQLSDAEAAPYYVNSNLFGTWDPFAVWSDLPSTNNFTPVIALANLRGKRTSQQSSFPFNLSWPVAGVKYELYRSSDNKVSYSSINNFTSNSDTTVAFQFTDALPPAGQSYYYFVKGSKGAEVAFTDTVLINTLIPLNGDFRSKGSGNWSNNVTYTVTRTSNTVTSIAVTSSPAGFDDANPPTVAITGGSGTGATATATVSGGKVTAINVTNAGSGYTGNPTVSLSGTLPASIWQKYTTSTSSWDDVAFGTAPSNANVIIRNGHTVTITALSSVNTLNVEDGAILNATTSNSLRFLSDIVNNGKIGTSTSDNKISLQYSNTAATASAKITGAGTAMVNALNTLAELQNATLTIDQDITIAGTMNALYGNSSNQNVNNITFIVNTGKTVKANVLHSSSTTATVVNYPKYGRYTYTINGTMDLSGSNTVSSFIPYEVTGSTDPTVTLNINGTLKLGAGLRALTTTTGTPETGKVYLNINDGGVVEGRASGSTLTMGNKYFSIIGSGALKLPVSSTAVLFPVGTSTASAVSLTNSGTSANISVSVKNTLDAPEAAAINKQWNVSSDATGVSLTIEPQWLSSDNGPFNPGSGSVHIIRYNGVSWFPYETVLNGTGTVASPYVATAIGITSFGSFSVSSNTALPLNLITFDVKKSNALANSADLKWQTGSEVNTRQFVVERGSAENKFAELGRVESKNVSGIHSYSFTDYLPLNGINYYRLKMIDLDGAFTYSPVKAIVFEGGESLGLYPNPVSDKLNFLIPASENATTVKILDLNGHTVMGSVLSASSGHGTIDVASLAAGTYVFTWQNGNNVKSSKFIKR